MPIGDVPQPAPEVELKNTALYMVKDSIMRNPVLVKFLEKRSLLVCEPTVDIDQVKTINPHAKLLCYYDATTCPAYGEGNTYYDGMREGLEPHYLQDIRNQYGNPELSLELSTAEAYADWINGNTDSRFDAVYLDQMWAVPPQDWVEGRGQENDAGRWYRYAEYLIDLINGRCVGNIGASVTVSEHLHLLRGITIEDAHLDRKHAIRSFAHYDP